MISHVISTGLENYLLLTSSDENVIVQPLSGRFVSFKYGKHRGREIQSERSAMTRGQSTRC